MVYLYNFVKFVKYLTIFISSRIIQGKNNQFPTFTCTPKYVNLVRCDLKSLEKSLLSGQCTCVPKGIDELEIGRQSLKPYKILSEILVLK